MEIKNEVFATDELGVDYYLISLNRLYNKSRIGEFLLAETRRASGTFIGLKKDGSKLDLSIKRTKRRRGNPEPIEVTDENFESYTTEIAEQFGDTSSRLKYTVGMTFGFCIGMNDEKFHEEYARKNPYLKPIPYRELPKTKTTKMIQKLAFLSVLIQFQNRSPLHPVPHGSAEKKTYRTISCMCDMVTSGTNVMIYGYRTSNEYRIFNTIYKEFNKDGIFNTFHKTLDQLIPTIQEKREKERLEEEKRNRLRRNRREIGNRDDDGFYYDDFYYNGNHELRRNTKAYEDPRTRKPSGRRSSQRFTTNQDPELYHIISRIVNSHLYLSALKAKLSFKTLKNMKKDFFELNKEKYIESI